jgi:hypothetical protein
MKTTHGHFTTKESARAIVNNQTNVAYREQPELFYYDKITGNQLDTANIITKTNTNLAGASPYLFSTINHICSKMPELVDWTPTDGTGQIGTEKNPFPMELLLRLSIGKHRDQYHLFMTEFGQLIKGQRKVWLPTNDKSRLILTEPFIISPITKNKSELTPEKIKQLDNFNIEKIIAGVIIKFHKPLFEGHRTGYKGGMFKEPDAWFAEIRNAIKIDEKQVQKKGGVAIPVVGDPGQIEKNPTGNASSAINTFKVWNYLNLADNSIGNEKRVNIEKLMDVMSPHNIKTKKDGSRTILTDGIIETFNAVSTIAEASRAKTEEMDFVLHGIILNNNDRLYAKNNPSEDFLISAARHHLKADKNHLLLEIERNDKRTKKV